MKKWYAPILILILAALLIACGKQITQGIQGSEKADIPPSQQPESNTGQCVQFIRAAYDINGHAALTEAHDCTDTAEIRLGNNTTFSRPCFHVHSHEELKALFTDINKNSYYYHSEELNATLSVYDAAFFEKNSLNVLVFAEEMLSLSYRYVGTDMLDEHTTAVLLDVLQPLTSDPLDTMTTLFLLPTKAETEIISIITTVWNEGEDGIMRKTAFPSVTPFSITPKLIDASQMGAHYFPQPPPWTSNYGNYDLYSYADTTHPLVERILDKEEFCRIVGKNHISPAENEALAAILANTDAFFEEYALIALDMSGTEFRVLDFEAKKEELGLTLEVTISEQTRQTVAFLFLPVEQELAKTHLTVHYQKPGTPPLAEGSIADADNVRLARISYPDHERALTGIPHKKITYRREDDAFLMRIRTREEFLILLGQLQKQGFYGTPDDRELAACYDDAFFEKNALFVLLWNESSGSYQIRFDSMCREENGTLTIGLTTTKFLIETDDMATRLLFVPVDAVYLDAEDVRMKTIYHYAKTYY